MHTETELRGWINKILAGLTVLVFGFVGSEFAALRTAVVQVGQDIVQVMERDKSQQKQLEDHEDRLRTLEWSSVKKKEYHR